MRVGDVIRFPAPPRTAFWSGAGISMDAPTRLPGGVALTERSLDQLFPAGTRDAVVALYGAMVRSPSLPRLETVLGVAAADDVLGVAALRVIRDMWAAEPNLVHRQLAAFANAGAWNITMNFDWCIESVVDPEGAGRVLHPHGSICDLQSVRDGASIVALERGFPPDMVEAIAETLNRASLIVFIGYSGSDFFDVDPFLKQWAAAGHAVGRTVLWVDHCSDPSELEFVPNPERRQVALLAAGGAHVYEVRAPTNAVLAEFAAAWRVNAAARPAARRTTISADVTVPPTSAGPRRAQKSGVTRMLSDPDQRVLFNLDDVDVWPGVTRAAAGKGGATDWELLQIMTNDFPNLEFWQGGMRVGNPFR